MISTKPLISRNTGSVKALLVVPAALLLVACSAAEPSRARAPEASSPTSEVASAQTRSPAATPTQPSTTPSPKATKPPHPISMQALINKKYDGRNLKIGRLLADHRRVPALHHHLPG